MRFVSLCAFSLFNFSRFIGKCISSKRNLRGRGLEADVSVTDRMVYSSLLVNFIELMDYNDGQLPFCFYATLTTSQSSFVMFYRENICLGEGHHVRVITSSRLIIRQIWAQSVDE